MHHPPTAQETQETQVRSLGQEDPLEEGMATYSIILAWRNPSGQRNLAGYSPYGCKKLDTPKATEHTRVIFWSTPWDREISWILHKAAEHWTLVLVPAPYSVPVLLIHSSLRQQFLRKWWWGRIGLTRLAFYEAWEGNDCSHVIGWVQPENVYRVIRKVRNKIPWNQHIRTRWTTEGWRKKEGGQRGRKEYQYFKPKGRESR